MVGYLAGKVGVEHLDAGLDGLAHFRRHFLLRLQKLLEVFALALECLHTVCEVLGFQRLVVVFQLKVPIFECQLVVLDFRVEGSLLSQFILCLELIVLKLGVKGPLLGQIILSL